MRMRPAVGSYIPSKSLTSMDFPAPFSPTRQGSVRGDIEENVAESLSAGMRVLKAEMVKRYAVGQPGLPGPAGFRGPAADWERGLLASRNRVIPGRDRHPGPGS